MYCCYLSFEIRLFPIITDEIVKFLWLQLRSQVILEDYTVLISLMMEERIEIRNWVHSKTSVFMKSSD